MHPFSSHFERWCYYASELCWGEMLSEKIFDEGWIVMSAVFVLVPIFFVVINDVRKAAIKYQSVCCQLLPSWNREVLSLRYGKCDCIRKLLFANILGVVCVFHFFPTFENLLRVCVANIFSLRICAYKTKQMCLHRFSFYSILLVFFWKYRFSI